MLMTWKNRVTTYENVVQNFQEMLVITNLLVTFWVIGIRLLVWDLLEHLSDEHVDSCVGLDELLELLENRMQFLWILLDMVNNTF